MKPFVTVVLPAAGAGTRLGGDTKQFRSLGGDPVFRQALKAFRGHSEVSGVVLVVPETDVSRCAEDVAGGGVPTVVVAGGATRQESVRNGVRSVPQETDLVLVHDSVRPFVSQELISRVIAATAEHGAAAPAIPVADTLRRIIPGSLFGTSLTRDGVFRMQTPQGARLDWLRDALEHAGRETINLTDEVEVLQRAGHSVRLVEGDGQNFKITRPADWELAQQLWPVWNQEGATGERENGREGEE